MANITVSVVTMDHLNIQRDVELVEAIGVDGLHIDIMDGHFVPRYGLYPEIVKGINACSSLPLDLHFMVNDLNFSLAEFRSCKNIETITFHLESCIGNELHIIDKIKEIGAKPIVALNLATSFNMLDRLIVNDEIDGVMLMGIHPGVLVQQARPQNIFNDLEKLKDVLSESSAIDYIALDGAVNFNTFENLLKSGITHFIGGSSSIFRGANSEMVFEERALKIKENWELIKRIIK
jgi:ribulose-phosphate 3-epimerase